MCVDMRFICFMYVTCCVGRICVYVSAEATGVRVCTFNVHVAGGSVDCLQFARAWYLRACVCVCIGALVTVCEFFFYKWNDRIAVNIRICVSHMQRPHTYTYIHSVHGYTYGSKQQKRIRRRE